jgi:hypothetical protein
MREPSEIFGPVRPALHAEFPADESVAWASPAFARWTGPSPGNDYGGKPIVDSDGRPAFAELAIVERLEASGWTAVWVSQSFGRPKFRRGFWGNPAAPEVPLSVLAELAACSDARQTSYKGTWDVVAWPANATAPVLPELRFLESKRRGKDFIGPEQVAWFKAMRGRGAALDAFLVVEWTLRDPVVT